MGGWVSTVLVATWAVWLAVWVVLAAFVKRTAARPANGWRYAVGAIGVAAVLVLRHHRAATIGQRHFEHLAWVEATVVGLLVLGLGISVWARVVLGGNWSGGVVLKERHELVQTGPYAIVRHPIYTGMLTMCLGTALYDDDALAAAVTAALALFFYAKSRREERLMLETFPDAYPAYRRRTKALIPYVL
ncbi:MAG TPA: isoprenylcysteine carboxylmethyltransferase family protein [Acidimicrobiales bacterium]|nr:isoprenylcysteine carboxylmethyltransferase family protein [Acidimicrobiales bacterium]